MTVLTRSPSNHITHRSNPGGSRVGPIVLALVGSAAIFLLGTPYFEIFEFTNDDPYFNGALTLGAGVLAWTLRHKDDAYAAVSSALFLTAAAMWSLVIGPFNWVISADPDTIEEAFQDKLAQFLAIVPVVLVVAWLVGRSRESLYLVRGNSSRWLKVGVPSLASWAVLMTLIAVADGAGVDAVVELAPWAIGFAVLNAAMEELWFRGISLQPYLEHLGAPVAIGLTAFVFGLAHVEATYMSDATQLPFAFLVLGLGVVLARIMHWSNSIWGAVLFHTGMGFIVIFNYL